MPRMFLLNFKNGKLKISIIVFIAEEIVLGCHNRQHVRFAASQLRWHDSQTRSTLTRQILSQSVYLIVALWHRKNCHFIDSGILWCCQLAATWGSWTRLHNYKPSPPEASESFLHSNAFMAKSCRQTRQTKKQTDRQANKKLNVFVPHQRRVKSEPHQTWHGDRGHRARSCSS